MKVLLLVLLALAVLMTLGILFVVPADFDARLEARPATTEAPAGKLSAPVELTAPELDPLAPPEAGESERESQAPPPPRPPTPLGGLEDGHVPPPIDPPQRP